MVAGVSNSNPIIQPVVQPASTVSTAPATEPIAPAPSAAEPVAPAPSNAAATLESAEPADFAQAYRNELQGYEQAYQSELTNAASQAQTNADLSELPDRTDDPAFNALLEQASDEKLPPEERQAANQELSKYIKQQAPAPADTFVVETQADKTQEQAQEKEKSGAKKEADKAAHAEKLSAQDRKIQTLQSMRDRVYAKYSKLPPTSSPLRKDLEGHLKDIDTATAGLNKEEVADKETQMREKFKQYGTLFKRKPQGESPLASPSKPQKFANKTQPGVLKIVNGELVQEGLKTKSPVLNGGATKPQAGKKTVVQADAKGDGDLTKKGEEAVVEKVVPPKEQDIKLASIAVAANVSPKTQAENLRRKKDKEELTRAIAVAKGKLDSSGEAALTKGGELAARRVKENVRHGYGKNFEDLERGTTSLAGVVYCTGGLDDAKPLSEAEGQLLVGSREDNDTAYNKVLKDRPNGFDTTVMHLWANWSPEYARTTAARAQAMHGNSAA